jgi:hemoglobin
VFGDESCVARIRSVQGVHEEMNGRPIDCFDRALEDVGLAGDEALCWTLHDWFV